MTIRADADYHVGGEAPPTRRVRAGLPRWLAHIAPIIGVFVAVFVAWEAAVHLLKIAPFVLPSPTLILQKMIAQWQLLLESSLATLQEILLGFGLSAIVGVSLAAAVVSSPLMERIIMPLVISFKTLPKVALAPILIIWFGYGILPKVLIVFLISFFPIVISSIVGLRATEKEMIYLARSMGASTLQTFLKFRFPKALPSIFGGLRIGVVQAVTGAIVAEYLASESGLGHLQIIAQSRLDAPLLFASVVVLTFLGLALFNLVVLAERLAMPWYREVDQSAI
jgi:NitT/TauT family transport system permease protein